MGIGLGKVLRVAAASCVVLVSSTIGPDSERVSVVSESRKVVGVYFEGEMEQIRGFRDNSRSILLARAAGINFDFRSRFGRDRALKSIVDEMFNTYSEMSQRVRKEVDKDMKDNYSCFENSNGGVLLRFYEEKACELGFDYSGSELVLDINSL